MENWALLVCNKKKSIILCYVFYGKLFLLSKHYNGVAERHSNCSND